MFQNNGLTTHEVNLGAPAYISNICVNGWYEWIYYRDHGAFPKNRYKLGKVLDPVKNKVSQTAQAIITRKGTVVTC